jgi:DNA repair protein RadD
MRNHHGRDTTSDRKRWLAAYKAGEIRCLTNNSVLTTGFNAPGVDLIAGLRPTLSTGLYVQMAGRGTRLAPGKDNCLYLDFARNCHQHGPVDDVEPRKPGKGQGEAPIKECPECHNLVPISVLTCECGYCFPIKDEAKHDATADVAPILKIDAMTPQVFQIKTRDFFRHLNPAGAESVRVEFLSGWVTYKMWLPIERMPGMCNKFWKSHGGAAPCPTTANEWLARQAELRPSKEFLYRKKPGEKYGQILLVKPEPEILNAAA